MHAPMLKDSRGKKKLLYAPVQVKLAVQNPLRMVLFLTWSIDIYVKISIISKNIFWTYNFKSAVDLG